MSQRIEIVVPRRVYEKLEELSKRRGVRLEDIVAEALIEKLEDEGVV